MTKQYLLETASLVGDVSSDGTWKVRLISEGRGSSGYYTAELLENHHHAFDNVLSFRNHPSEWDGPTSRDFTMIAGEIIGETWIETDERGMIAVYGNYLPDPEHADKLERYKKKLGLSIFIEGSGYIDEDSGEFIVDWFNPEDPFASVDVVIAAGARGKFMESMRKTYESAIAETDKPSVTSALVEERKLEMDKEFEERFAAIETILKTLVAAEQATQAEAAQVEADENAGRVAIEAYDAQLVAIEAAELPAELTESLRAQAKEGKDVSAAVATAKAIKESMAASVAQTVVETTAPGRVLSETAKPTSAIELGKALA